MNITTLYPHQPTMVEPRPRGQGRSKKPLRIKLEFDGRVFVARFLGRPNFCFGDTEKEATYNLRSGQ
jgi:hypothetical protein